jgi:hypothetical protein
MIKDHTVFILGAGASVPYNFPTAAGLRQYLIGDFLQDYEDNLNSKGLSEYDVEDFCRPFESIINSFKLSSVISIDRFLAQSGDPVIVSLGKLAIAFSLLRNEKASKFREDSEDVRHDWYTYLFNQMIGREMPTSTFDISLNNISFITFNYDRSLEHFFWESYSNSFRGMNPDELQNCLAQVKIHHVYGSLGPINWQANEDVIPYGHEPGWAKYAAKRINIVHESTENSDLQGSIYKSLISSAKSLYFLGFGFDRANLERIGLPEALNKEQEIYGTAFNMLDAEIARIHAALGRTINNRNTHILKCDSRELLRKFLY